MLTPALQMTIDIINISLYGFTVLFTMATAVIFFLEDPTHPLNQRAVKTLKKTTGVLWIVSVAALILFRFLYSQ